MKEKTIKSVLRKKFNEFTRSITDDNVRKLVKKNSIITGGSIASMFWGEEVNDYDVYFTNKETVLAVCEYYCEIFNKRNGCNVFSIIDGTIPHESFTREDGNPVGLDWYDDNVTPGRIKIRVQGDGIVSENTEEYRLDCDLDDLDDKDDISNNEYTDKFRPVYISANAITLSDDFQLIIRFFGDVETIHENYDYEHCKCSWTSDKGELGTPELSLKCLLARDLVYSGSKYPLASIIRSRKFIQRGFSINAGQYLKMCLDLAEYDLRDLKVLESQLTGVDAFWFALMLKHIDGDKLKDDVDNTYVFELINRFF